MGPIRLSLIVNTQLALHLCPPPLLLSTLSKNFAHPRNTSELQNEKESQKSLQSRTHIALLCGRETISAPQWLSWKSSLDTYLSVCLPPSRLSSHHLSSVCLSIYHLPIIHPSILFSLETGSLYVPWLAWSSLYRPAALELTEILLSLLPEWQIKYM